MIILLSLIILLLLYVLYESNREVKELQQQVDKQFDSILELSKEMREDYPKMSNYAWEIRRRRILQALNKNTYTGK